MADNFGKFAKELNSPCDEAFAITTGSSDLAYTTRYLYVGATGNLCVQMATARSGANSIVTFIAVPTGTVLPIRVNKVFANSTANSIIGLY